MNLVQRFNAVVDQMTAEGHPAALRLRAAHEDLAAVLERIEPPAPTIRLDLDTAAAVESLRKLRDDPR